MGGVLVLISWSRETDVLLPNVTISVIDLILVFLFGSD
jgi:hypothetical protein